MAGAKGPAPATTKIETHINTGTYLEFLINGHEADLDLVQICLKE